MSLSDLSVYTPTVDLSQKAVFEEFEVIVPASYGGTYLLNALETIQVQLIGFLVQILFFSGCF